MEGTRKRQTFSLLSAGKVRVWPQSSSSNRVDVGQRGIVVGAES